MKLKLYIERLEFCDRGVRGFLKMEDSFNVNAMVQSTKGMSNARIIEIILKHSDKVITVYNYYFTFPRVRKFNNIIFREDFLG